MNIYKNNKISFLIIIVIILASIHVSEKEAAADTGIGIILGTSSGISLKFNNFPVLGIGYNVYNALYLHCDYWLKNTALEKSFYWYIGLGGKLHIKNRNDRNARDNTNEIGVTFRVPIGLQYLIDEKFELFGEVVPGITIFPATEVDFDAGIGIRYHI